MSDQLGLPLPPPPSPTEPEMSNDAAFPRDARFEPAAGNLVGWSRLAHQMVWVGIGVGLAMVARSSYVTGLGTWWVGPPGDQNNVLMVILPFLVPLIMIVLTMSWSPRIPWYGIAGSVILGGVAVADIGYVKGYALVEGALAACGLVVSVASLYGRYQAEDGPAR